MVIRSQSGQSFLETAFERKLETELTEEESRVFQPSTEEKKCCVIIDADGWLSGVIIVFVFVKKVRGDGCVERGWWGCRWC